MKAKTTCRTIAHERPRLGVTTAHVAGLHAYDVTAFNVRLCENTIHIFNLCNRSAFKVNKRGQMTGIRLA